MVILPSSASLPAPKNSKRSHTSTEASSCPLPSKKPRSSAALQLATYPTLTSFEPDEKDRIDDYALEMPGSTKDTHLHAISMGLDADLVSHRYSKSDACGVVRTCSKESQKKLPSLSLKKLKKKIEHVSDLHAWKDLNRLSDRDPRKFIDMAVNDQIFRTIVVQVYYEPLEERLKKNPDSLKEMAKQLINCVHELRFDAHILHGDISTNNIVYTVKGGKDCFVLIDFDLGVHVDENGHALSHSSLHRMGTLPFMAVELIYDLAETYNTSHMEITQKQRRCVRHDFESLFWVSLWCAIRFASPTHEDGCGTWKEKNGRYLSRWESDSADNISVFKDAIFSGSHHFKRALSYLSPSFKHMGGWFAAFRLPFAKATYASIEDEAKYSYEELIAATPGKLFLSWSDHETGYGKVTRDTLMQALGQCEVLDIDSPSKKPAEE